MTLDICIEKNPVVIILPIIIFIILLFIGVFFLIFKKFNKRYKSFVSQHSISIKQLTQLNRKYRFYSVKSIIKEHEYDNENNYENVSCVDYAIGYINENLSNVINEVNKSKVNHDLYYIYSQYVSKIKINSGFDGDIGKLKLNKLIKIENNLFKRYVKTPKISLDLRVILYETKINGQRLRKKTQIFNQEEIEYIIGKLKNRSGNFYNDNDIWMSLVRYERGKVSNRLRFLIYKRDRYRCCKCGRSGHNDLEIDHIIPISKGGKTELDNLQTLCRRCNKEKGNRIN